MVRQATVQGLLEWGPDHSDTARSMYDLAEILLVRKRLTEAQRYCERAREIDESIHGHASLETARDNELLARIISAMGDPRAAAPLVEEAIAIQSSKLGDESVELARSLDTRSEVLLALGDFGPRKNNACVH